MIPVCKKCGNPVVTKITAVRGEGDEGVECSIDERMLAICTNPLCEMITMVRPPHCLTNTIRFYHGRKSITIVEKNKRLYNECLPGARRHQERPHAENDNEFL